MGMARMILIVGVVVWARSASSARFGTEAAGQPFPACLGMRMLGACQTAPAPSTSFSSLLLSLLAPLASRRRSPRRP
jgi:hypothetical protein